MVKSLRGLSEEERHRIRRLLQAISYLRAASFNAVSTSPKTFNAMHWQRETYGGTTSGYVTATAAWQRGEQPSVCGLYSQGLQATSGLHQGFFLTPFMDQISQNPRDLLILP